MTPRSTGPSPLQATGTVARLGTWIVNWYAVEEEGRWTVLDAGVPGYWPQLEQHGISPSTVDAVVLTHAHADHVGVAERLRRAGATVYVHEDDEGLATTAKPAGSNEASVASYLRHGMAWRLLAHLMRNGASRPQPIGEVRTFTDGEQLDVPGRPRAIHTPGHTRGHCCFHLERARVLIAGDLLCTLNPLTGARGPQLMPRGFNVSSARMLDSLARIEDVDADIVYPGHGEPWTGGLGDAVARVRATGPT